MWASRHTPDHDCTTQHSFFVEKSFDPPHLMLVLDFIFCFLIEKNLEAVRIDDYEVPHNIIGRDKTWCMCQFHLISLLENFFIVYITFKKWVSVLRNKASGTWATSGIISLIL